MIETCANLCLASYDDSAKGFTAVDDLRYGIVSVAACTYVVIRGTANVENWLRDADVIPSRSCGGYLAHSGFVDAYRRLCSGGMLAAIPAGPVVATGHSLGGSIATLLAEHLGCKLISFGSPKVYFRFGAKPKIDHTRIIGSGDPVPFLPGVMYRHINDPTVVKDDDAIVEIHDHAMSTYIAMMQKRGLM